MSIVALLIVFLVPDSPVTRTLQTAPIAGFSAWGRSASGVRARQTPSLCFANDVEERGYSGGGGESVHRFKSAPARAAEFISNVLTPLALQIETSSGARRGGGCERRQDDLGAADAAERLDQARSTHIWRMIAVLISA